MVRLVVAALGCLAVASAYTPSVAPSGALLAKPAISTRASGKRDSPSDPAFFCGPRGLGQTC